MIQVNGKDVVFSGTIAELIEKFNLNRKAIVVELNGTIVHREEYDNTRCHKGDIIEMVSFVGGG